MGVLGIGVYGALKLKQRNKKKDGEDKEKNRCFNIEKMLEDKLHELTDLKGQLENKVKEAAKEKVRESIEGTLAGELMKRVEKAQGEYEKLKKLYKECKIELMKKSGKRLFITGIPTAGKSYLAKKLARELNGEWLSTDNLRAELIKNPAYKPWILFYWNQDEYVYYTTTNYDEQWNNLVKQSESLWPGILEIIKERDKNDKPIIFEGVNILPHLANNDLGCEGIVLIGKSFEEVFERIKKEPRWGKTEELQRLEAKAFFEGERIRYKEEAEKYGYKVFEDVETAYKEAIKFLK